MPKYRQLYTKVIDSFDFNEMPDDFTRVVWLMLPLILDCEGRGIGNMAWVKSKLFPLRIDVTADQLEDSFKWLQDRKMVVFYEVESRLYFYIPTFKTYQKGTEYETSSLLPAPLEVTLNQSQGNFKVSSDQPPPAASASASAYESASAIDSESPQFDKIKSHIEKITGIPAMPKSIRAIEEIIEFGGSSEDITAGYGWFKDNADKPLKYYSQLIGPTRTAMSIRVNGKNGKGKRSDRRDTPEARAKYAEID